jgi:6-phosphogluconolactonase
MTLKQTIQAVPKKRLSKESFVSASEIRIHPSGKFVYSANRGHDTITVFSVDQDNGKLKFVERENVRGATPRNFNLDPSAKWLLAGGQDSNTLASFSVNSETGELSYNRSIINTPAPICVLFERE